jgi:zinc transport system substrate-binding protein
MKLPVKSLLVILISGLISCPVSAEARLFVFVSILPQHYFVQQIGRSLVNVSVMVHPGASPAVYEPKPSQMAALSKADIYFAVGVPFERTWLNKISAANPGMRVVHTDNGIEKRVMAGHRHEETEHEEKNHGSHHNDHDTREPDPHIWLSPRLVITQVKTITAALQKADPTNAAAYETHSRQFIDRIQNLDRELTRLFSGFTGRPFMVFHPSWGYFADAYGLKQVAIEVEGKSPKPALLRKLIAHARENHIRVIFAQPQFSAKSAELIAREINGKVIFADPLALDWEKNLTDAAHKFAEVLQ